MRPLLVVGVVLVQLTAIQAQQPVVNENDPPPVQNRALQLELLAMSKADQDARASMARTAQAHNESRQRSATGYYNSTLELLEKEVRKVAEVDRKNRARLGEIVNVNSWPGKTLVGKDGAHAAWMLVQHFESDLVFQTNCLKLMEAAPPGEVEGKDIAYLTDRVLVSEKKMQRYGTQMDDKLWPLPIQDAANVDKRRAALGMPPLGEYVHSVWEAYGKLGERKLDKK